MIILYYKNKKNSDTAECRNPYFSICVAKINVYLIPVKFKGMLYNIFKHFLALN